MWLAPIEAVACDIVGLRLLLFTFRLRLDRYRLPYFVWLAVIFQDVAVEDDENVLIFDEVALELLQAAYAALLELVVMDYEVKLCE